MNKRQKKLWDGLNAPARNALTDRDYKEASFAQRVANSGVDASELASIDRRKPEAQKIWIPGVEIFSRKIHCQRHRGLFGEFARQDEGVLKNRILAAAMGRRANVCREREGFSRSSAGYPFRYHGREMASAPVPGTEPQNYALRRYDREQWDVMFFVQGRVEMILRDCRAGLPARTMRLFVDGDNHCRQNNAGVVIPPGVAHAIRAEGSEDVIMVYGTSTSFHPEFEGRIASEVETAALPDSWQKFLSL